MPSSVCNRIFGEATILGAMSRASPQRQIYSKLNTNILKCWLGEYKSQHIFFEKNALTYCIYQKNYIPLYRWKLNNTGT